MPDVDFQSMTKKEIDMWAEENLRYSIRQTPH